ncbi:MAG: D-alanyl-D-alanine carboxypeptidase family protein [Candidatus Pacebacteria bacterium]|nr:D-alanyl-D-alanine carboxypeptidase family protein [Candidatus Paceibacterota bacterium]
MKNSINILFLLFLIFLFSVFLFLNIKKQKEYDELAFSNFIQTHEKEVFSLNKKNLEQGAGLSEKIIEIEFLKEQLEEEQNLYNELEEKIEKIAKSVGILEKIKKVDKELLAKYSKVYFLNEHYTPKNLEDIEEKFLFNTGKKLQIRKEINEFLEEMFEDAKDDNIILKIISAYRSYEYQGQIKDNGSIIHGQDYADKYIADQGLSEHQLGTTIDIVSKSGKMTGFDDTEEYQWLLDNAHKYGFILSYPEKNYYYNFEPWHWRFVGKKLADDLYDDKKYFYDLSQRNINKYTQYFFDD